MATFEEWSKKHKFSESLSKALTETGLADLDTLRELKKEHIAEDETLSALNLGDKLKLGAALRDLTTPATSAATEQKEEPITTKSLASQPVELEAVTKLLGALGISQQSSQNPPTQGKKKLSIPDFVSYATTAYDDQEQDVLKSEGGGPSLVLKTKRKPRVEEVSLGQFISSNARIMLELQKRGEMSDAVLTDYCEHMIRVGDYTQTHTVPSVMLYDDRVREDQLRKHKSWADDYQHAAMHLLVKRPPKQNNNGGNYNKRRQHTDERPCLDYNNAKGCNRTYCKYAHVCAEKDCTGKHPQYQHPSSQPASGAPRR